MGGEIGSEHMIHGALAEVDSYTSSSAVVGGVNMFFCLLFLVIKKSVLVPSFFVRELIEILPIAKSTFYYSNDKWYQLWTAASDMAVWGLGLFSPRVTSLIIHFPQTLATGDREIPPEFRKTSRLFESKY